LVYRGEPAAEHRRSIDHDDPSSLARAFDPLLLSRSFDNTG
jgi:hypothetical protein